MMVATRRVPIMSYLQGGYLNGDAGLTSDDALDHALAQATSNKQLANFKYYWQQVSAMTPAARAQLVDRLNATLAALPSKTRSIVGSMSMRTASYADPRAVVGLGGLEAIGTIVSTVATLATLGLTVASALDARKKSKAEESRAAKTEKLNQEMLRAQLADVKAQQAARMAPTSGAAIAPDGSIIVPAKTSPAAIATGIALTGAAAYMLTR